jgi:hypothetical protein
MALSAREKANHTPRRISPRPDHALHAPATLATSKHRAWPAWLIAGLSVALSLTIIDAPADAQTDPQAAAIQAVIQQALQAEVQAVATGDPSPMSATATASYYRQLVQTGQSLAADGVTSIALTQLTWGPISVNGNTATATTTETWLTTYADGSTTATTATNEYTLVLRGGTWLIDASRRVPGPGASGTPVPTPMPAPAMSVGHSTSNNWSGYMALVGPFTAVSGTWAVPQPVNSGAGGVGATWVGIGGVSSNDLIQAGTSDTVVKGQDRFESWIEVLPQASQQVPLAVAPGDSVTVSIDEQGAGTGMWQMTMTNNTSGQSYQTTVSYTSSHSSAEWIQEAPTGSTGVLPLDNFGSVSFTASTTTANDEPRDLTQANARPVTMVNSNNEALAVPSSIGDDGASFTVTRTSAPATTSNGGTGQRPSGTPQTTPTPQQ